MFNRIAMLLILVSVLLACGAGEESTPKTESSPAPTEPALPSYRVVSDDSMPPYKLQVTVELDKRVSEKDLAAVAKKIREQGPQHERAYVNFNIANEPPPDPWAHWAMVKWEPGDAEPKVSILY